MSKFKKKFFVHHFVSDSYIIILMVHQNYFQICIWLNLFQFLKFSYNMRDNGKYE